MSIDYMNDYEIVDEINEEDEFGGPIDDDDLIDHDSWSEICAARGRHFNDVDPIAWQMLCARRGKILYRLKFSSNYNRYYRRSYNRYLG